MSTLVEARVTLYKVGVGIIVFSIIWSVFLFIFAYHNFKATRKIEQKIKEKSEYMHKYTKDNA